MCTIRESYLVIEHELRDKSLLHGACKSTEVRELVGVCLLEPAESACKVRENAIDEDLRSY